MNDTYLIKSVDRNQWWKPGERGYTSDVEEAGRYSLDDAVRICFQANRFSDEIKELYVAAPCDETPAWKERLVLR